MSDRRGAIVGTLLGVDTASLIVPSFGRPLM
jgi:hypothetical protein